MRSLTSAFVAVSLFLVFIIGAPASSAQETKPTEQASVSVPAYPNSNCPVMGKQASPKLFVDTPKGRIYMCCSGCTKRIKADVDAAYKTAYPKTEKVKNTVCPITSDAIKEGAPTVTLQGREIALCCDGCIKKAQASSQATLAKAIDPKIVDIANDKCPVTGKAVDPNAIVTIGNELIHVSGADGIEAVRSDPAKYLAKAKEIAAKNPKKEGKMHDEQPKKDAEPKVDKKGGHDHGGNGNGDHDVKNS